MNKYYKWELLTLLSFAFFFNQADRALFGILLQPIQADLKLTASQMGLVATILFATLAFLMPLTGLISDRFNKKHIVTGCLLFWSVSTMLTGWARGFVSLAFLRSVATGGGEAFYTPAAYPLLAAYHKSTRSIAMAIHQGAFYLGVILTGFIAGWLADQFGWRYAFLLYGVGGIVLGIICIFRLKGIPQEEPANTGQETARQETLGQEIAGQEIAGQGTAGQETAGQGTAGQETARQETLGQGTPGQESYLKALGALLTNKSFLLLTIGFTAIVFVNNAYMTWSPKYLFAKYQLDLGQAGGYSMLYHNLAALLGILFGGLLTDRLVRWNQKVRLELQTFALLFAIPAIFAVGSSSTLASTCIALAVFGLFRGLYEANTHAAVFDVVEPRIRGMAVAGMTFVAFLLGSTSPWLMGQLSDRFGDAQGLAYGFEILAAVYAIGFFALTVALLFTFKRDRIEE